MSIVVSRNLALVFLLPATMEYGDVIKWELADIRGGLLLLMNFGGHWRRLDDLVVCDPLAQRYKTIPLSAWFHNRDCIGAVLLDGEDAGGRISQSNFRLTCAFYRDGVAKTYAFSPTAGGTWTSDATVCGSRVICGNDYWTATGPVKFEGSAGGSVYRTVGNHVLALNKETDELSSTVLPDALRGKPLALEHMYELPSPPTIRAVTWWQAICGGPHRP